jgi:hypothetical protein
MCTCEWCVIAERRVWSTDVIPTFALSRLGSAAIVSVASALA